MNVYAESAGYHGGDTCVINVIGGSTGRLWRRLPDKTLSRNLCQNSRGHNIVVVDPITEEFESVNFDTWWTKHEVNGYK